MIQYKRISCNECVRLAFHNSLKEEVRKNIFKLCSIFICLMNQMSIPYFFFCYSINLKNKHLGLYLQTKTCGTP